MEVYSTRLQQGEHEKVRTRKPRMHGIQMGFECLVKSHQSEIVAGKMPTVVIVSVTNTML